MKISSLLRSLAAALAVAAGCAHATPIPATQLVSNGGFESITLASGTWSTPSTLSGWTVGPLGVEIRNNAEGSAYAGNNFAELDTTGNSWISQTLATTAGGTYTLSFAYAPRENVPSTSNGIAVYWNGSLLNTYTATGGGTGSNNWQVFTYNLGATSGSTELKFMAVGLSDTLGGSLDAVSVTRSAVPEPATLATMAFGLGMMGFVRRRKSRK